MALSYNLGYQESISVHPTRRQILAGKPDSTFPNIWQWLIYMWLNIVWYSLCHKTRKKSFAWYFVFHMWLNISVMLDILFHILFHIVLDIVRFICGWIRPGHRGWAAPARSKSCDNSVCWPAAATAVDVEFVKSFTPVRFPQNFQFSREKRLNRDILGQKFCCPAATAVDVLNQRYAMISSILWGLRTQSVQLNSPKLKFCLEVFNKLRLIRREKERRGNHRVLPPLVYILNIYNVCKQMLPRTRSPLQDIRLRHQDFVQDLIPAKAKLPVRLPSTLNSAQLNFSLLPSCQSCSAAKKWHLGLSGNSGRHCALRKTGRAAHRLLASKLLPLHRER